MSSIKEAMERLQGPVPVSIVSGTVTAVRPDDEACDVQLDDDGPVLPDVALLGGLYPAAGSPALVGLVEGRLTDAFLLTADELSHIQLATAQESFLTWAQDFIDELLRLTVTTPLGPSGTPINAAQLTALKNRLPNLFRA
ncbi:hypothetical protein LJ737_19940 [Hymenobacter sp. 15J16-1T3B]|uniref:hypothetical protein n=1 Tax=Hymenobacter sp. 15J16-1T3B TaxID=2886941 RepID=UPI001D1051F9|nr:hypothetical protein [Hymenobacter sp. 15J16-1T3B]MCC3159524.1 hypothetical protein [Hymenobacter sp. 15J16-1T3B]